MKTQRLIVGLIMAGFVLIPHISFAIEAQFSPSYDGHVQTGANQPDWASCRGDTDGVPTAELEDTATTYNLEVKRDGANDYYCGAIFINFDTASLPDDAIIDSGALLMYATAKGDAINQAQSYVTVTGLNTMASATTLTATDFDQRAFTKYSDDLDITGITTSAYNTFTLNSTGLMNINLSAITKLNILVGHDIENVDPAANGSNNVRFASEENATSTFRPVLKISYHQPASSAASSASSVSSSCSGTGCNLNLSGSLVITHSACNQYILDGSGSAIGCDSWDTAIEIPAVRFFVSAAQNISMLTLTYLFLGVIAFFWVKAILSFIFRVLTQRI